MANFYVVSTIYSLILFIVASTKHFLIGTHRWDFGIFHQFSWLIANGKLNEISSIRQITPLQDHFSLLLIPIGAIYKIIPSGYTLIALQSIALGIIPAIAYKYAIQRNSPAKISLALTIAILLCPYIFLVNLADFHPEVVVSPIMFIAIWESVKKRRLPYYISILVILCAKKSLILFTIGIAIYTWIKGKRRRSLYTCIISLIWAHIAWNYSEVSVNTDVIMDRLGYLGDSKFEVLLTLVSKPWKIFNEASPESIFLYSLGLSLPFIALFNKRSWPALMGTLPFYITNILSSSGMQRELNTHYSIGIIPFLIFACLDSVEGWKEVSQKTIRRIYYLTICLSIVSFLGYSRIGYFQSRYFPRLNEAIALHQVKASIPKNSSVLTSEDYQTHFADRLLVMAFPYKNDFPNYEYLPIDQYDYIILPEKSNNILWHGKLRPLSTTDGESHRVAILKEAKRLRIACESKNKYIRVCNKSSSNDNH